MLLKSSGSRLVNMDEERVWRWGLLVITPASGWLSRFFALNAAASFLFFLSLFNITSLMPKGQRTEPAPTAWLRLRIWLKDPPPAEWPTLHIDRLYDTHSHKFDLISRVSKPRGVKINLLTMIAWYYTSWLSSSLGSTPVALNPAQRRIWIRPSTVPNSPCISLFYNRSEYEEVVNRRCAFPGSSFCIDIESRDYLFALTSGHPGAVHGMLEYLFAVYIIDHLLHTSKAADKGNIDMTIPIEALKYYSDYKASGS